MEKKYVKPEMKTIKIQAANLMQGSGCGTNVGCQSHCDDCQAD